jgi:5'-nucleotidase
VTVVVTNDDGVESPGIHALAAMLVRLGLDAVVVAPARDMSGASAAIGRIEIDLPTPVAQVRLPEPAHGVEAYAVDGPPGLAALLAVRGGIDGVDPHLVVSGINMGTNTGHSILHSGTVGAALTAATFGVSGLAVSLAVSDPMRWDAAFEHVEEALELLGRAPRATVLNVNVPHTASSASGGLRWATLDRFGSFRVAVAERRDAEVQLEYRAAGSGHELDPGSDTALVDSGVATVTALEALHAVPPEQLPFLEPPPVPEERLAPGPRHPQAVERRAM